MHYDCLIVDDEAALSQSTCEYFNLFDVNSFWVDNAQSCLRFFAGNSADLILLDINLGDSSGFDLCKRLRQMTDIPILFISARRSDDDMLLALSIGGDDYIQKPYALSVLLAKVKVVLGRYRNNRNTSSPGLAVGRLVLDEAAQALYLDGRRIDLKQMEFKLISYLMRNPNRVLSKEELFRKVWEDSIRGITRSTCTSAACGRSWKTTPTTPV